MSVPDAVWVTLTPRDDAISGKIWVRWFDVVAMRDFHPGELLGEDERRFTIVHLKSGHHWEVTETPETILDRVRQVRARHRAPRP